MKRDTSRYGNSCSALCFIVSFPVFVTWLLTYWIEWWAAAEIALSHICYKNAAGNQFLSIWTVSIVSMAINPFKLFQISPPHLDTPPSSERLLTFAVFATWETFCQVCSIFVWRLNREIPYKCKTGGCQLHLCLLKFISEMLKIQLWNCTKSLRVYITMSKLTIYSKMFMKR